MSDAVDQNGKLCDLFSQLEGSKGKNRAAPFGAGADTSAGAFDLTLNGLVAP